MKLELSKAEIGILSQSIRFYKNCADDPSSEKQMKAVEEKLINAKEVEDPCSECLMRLTVVNAYEKLSEAV